MPANLRNATHPHVVFVYGSLLKGLVNHPKLDGARFVGTAVMPLAELYDLGHFPGLLPAGSGAGSVRGELYRVDDRTLERLDRLEGHPGFYMRKQFVVRAPFGADRTDQMEFLAWVYVLPRDFVAGRPWVKSGDWRAYVAEWAGV